ncbi:MAG: cell division protein ZapA [Bacteroidales bacterium]|nr:cell division protein ZapA [Bacteroidales bacterium]MBQ3677711.1 cell division protein ZapA [Bacteroidales bacterium]MBQ4214745.1 cell division protein ZapA [Bacteroidales bacterium]MBR4498002.1 cell division protein ZapA [Bacteroidales bacterium]MBR4691099.1 cell division protein ZapA [Bacteroidales bacterium]
MSENLNIHLSILGKELALSIPSEEEEKLREAGKRINDMVEKFRQKYPTADAQSLLTMSILQIARRLLDAEQNLQNDTIGDELERVCEQIDDFIKINQ